MALVPPLHEGIARSAIEVDVAAPLIVFCAPAAASLPFVTALAEIRVAKEPAEFVTSPVNAGMTTADRVPELIWPALMLLFVRV